MSDRKFAVPSDTSSLIDHYEPHIVTAQDYYPFGMLSRVSLPNSGKSYKFGFNGKLNDNEVKGGLGNQLDFGARIYDPRIGRFLSSDPRAVELPDGTPYEYADNSPIALLDVNGEEGKPGFTIRTCNGNINIKQPLTGGLSRESLEQYVAERVNEINPKQAPLTRSQKVVPAVKYLRRFLNAISIAIEVITYETEAKPLFEKLGKDNYYEYTAAIGFLGMSKHLQGVNNSFEIITSDPSSLPDWYVQTVKERLMSGKAEASDWQYKDELIKRGVLSSEFGNRGAALRYQLKSTDSDWRGTNKTFTDALDEAFRRTGVDRKDFKVTKWGKNKYGKSIPVEYRAKNGAEVSVDFAHKNEGPDAPHVGWQTPGKRSSGGAQRGHIILNDVPAGRSGVKE